MATFSIPADKKMHTGPTMKAYATTFTVTRSSPADKNVRVTGDYQFRMTSSGGYYGSPFGPRGISCFVKTPQANTGNIGNKHSFNRNVRQTISVDITIEWTSGTLEFYSDCGFSDSSHMGVDKCDSDIGNDVLMGSLSIDNVPYNPYTPASGGVTSHTVIGRLGVSSWGVSYNYNCGSEPKLYISAAIHDWGKTNWGVRWEPRIATVSGSGSRTDYYTLKSDQGFTSGNHYRLTVVANTDAITPWLSPNSWNPSEGREIRTYQEPTISSSTTNIGTKRANDCGYTFSLSGTNNRKWSDNEQEFQTRYRYKHQDGSYTGWTNLGNTTSWARTTAEMRALVPKGQDGKQATFQFKRFSPSAPDSNGAANGWYSTNTQTFTITLNYRPRKGVTCANTSYRKNNSSGTALSKGTWVTNDSNLTGIYVSWVYDNTTSDAGWTQGYRIRLYNAAGTHVKTYYTTSKSYTIPKADIPKMQKTYIDITPYYANDQSNVASSANAGNYWYYNGTITKCDFVVMAAKLAKPSITYPVEGSQWINNKFRVCFQLPTDPDKGSETETYVYEDIELDVNGKVFRLTASPAGGTSGAVQAKAVFSSESLTYQRKMIAAPFKGSGFPNATTYKIRVRVKKKYTTDKTNWSDWSATRTFTVATASFTPARGDIIYATHYNNAKKVINRVRNTYGVVWNNAPADVSKGTKILRTQYPYANLYDRIVATKNQVNNYGTFDSGHTDVRFDNSNTITASFSQYVELVTAASNEAKSDASGRNYMRIIYDRCNKLI